jgi:beta-glucanase (GH16 family)
VRPWGKNSPCPYLSPVFSRRATGGTPISVPLVPARHGLPLSGTERRRGGEVHRLQEQGEQRPLPPRLTTQGPRRAKANAGHGLIVGVGLASVIVLTAVLAGGTAPTTPSGQGKPTGVPASQSTPTMVPSTAPAPSTTLPAPSSSPAARATAPRPAAPSSTAAPVPTSTTVPTTPAAAPPEAGDASSSDCGGQPTVTVNDQQWQCTFDDEFDGTTLDTSKWAVEQTADGGYHSGIECDEDSPSNVSVSGGTLNLTAEQAPSPFLCPGAPPYETDYTSGMVSTYQRFDQTDGLFEINAKVSGADTQGLQTSFWLYPAQLTYGPWPASGEIDIAELFSQYPTLAIPFVHYDPSASDPDDTNDDCVIGHPSQFHTYAVEWTPESLTFLYDGQTCLVDHWKAASPLIDPAPFNQPFYVCLTQALGIGTNEFIPGTTPLPATTSVDWVRVWGVPASGN